MRYLTTIGAMLALCVALAPGRLAGQDDPSPTAGLDIDRCVLTERGALALSPFGEARVAAGETLAIEPGWTPFPSWYDAVPARCFTRWRVSDPSLARLARDRGSVRVAANAPAGSSFVVSARYRGRTVERRFTVVERVASPLVGNWRPVAGACAPGTAITGMLFRDDGSFAVETVMRPHYSPSASGTWRVEDDQLLVTIARWREGRTVQEPSEAHFTIVDDVLRFDSIWHGSVEGHGTCNAPLERRR